MLAILVFDQFTKHLIRSGFAVGESHPVIQNVLHITYVQNTGAAFSMFTDMPLFTIGVPIITMLICLYICWRAVKAGEQLLFFNVALIMTGGIGNLIDRLMLGFVTDMIDFRVFPVFNVADIAVTCGCGLVILWALLYDRIEKRMKEKETNQAA